MSRALIRSIVLTLLPASVAAGAITDNDILATNGNEIGSGNGTLNLLLLTESSGGSGNTGGSFNGDDSNTQMPTGSGNTTANESYITSIGDLRNFYILNFPNGSGGSTVTQIAISVDVNETGQVNDIKLDELEIVRNYTANFTPAADARNTPAASDVGSSRQNLTDDGYTGGTVLTQLDASPKTLALNQQGAGWADYVIFTGINPFDVAYSATDRILFHWESSDHDNGGETIFLSGEYSPQDVVAATPEPFGLAPLLGLGSLMLRRRRQ